MIVYNLDFILDNRQHSSFKKWNFRSFLVILFFSINASWAFYLLSIDPQIVFLGLVLVFLLALYFVLLHFYRYFFLIKELIVALLFSFSLLGVFLSKGVPSSSLAVQFFIIFLVLFHNSLIFSIANVNKDLEKNQESLVTYFLEERVKKAADGVGFLGVLFTLFNRSYYLEPWLSFYVIIIFLLQGILLKNVSWLAEKKVFYLVGNSLFFIAFLVYSLFFYLFQLIEKTSLFV